MLLSDVCLLHTSGLSREQRGLGRPNWHRGSPRHTWLGHHFQGQRSKVTRPLYSSRPLRVRQVQRWPWERIGRGKILLRCVCSAAREALERPPGRRGAGHIVSPRAQFAMPTCTTKQLVASSSSSLCAIFSSSLSSAKWRVKEIPKGCL